jgi:sensor histidine kinase YesM
VLRFPNVHVEYRIIDKEFRIPALSIQPLVENAIWHGVCGLRDGHAAVSTVREDDFHLIIVEDNGTGFDPAQQKDQVKEHIGFKIVKERIEQMCGQ